MRPIATALVAVGVLVGLVTPATMQPGAGGNHRAAVRSSRAAAISSRPSSPGVAPVERDSEAAPIGPPHVGRGQEAATFAHTAVAAAPTHDGRGFWVAWADGTVTASGDAVWYGDMSPSPLNRPIVGIAPTADGRGYWLLGGDGGVFSFGDAQFFGSTGNMRLNAPALQMVATGDGRGYWFVAADGGIFTFGDAGFYGSTGNIRLNRPVVGMATPPGGSGYWLVASDGGIFAFGGASFHGSTGNMTLGAPVVAIAPTASGAGYWLVGQDGGIFTFGDAGFHGSGSGQTGAAWVIGAVATGDGGGYWLVLSNGGVLSYGNAAQVVAPAGAGQPAPDNRYNFEVANGSGQPARWNPCDTVHYSVVWPGAPAGWQGDVADAIAQVSAATGMQLVSDGDYASSLQVPGSTELTIAWAPSLNGGDQVGLTTYWYVLDRRYTPQMTASTVTILTGIPGGNGAGREEPVLLHELGHAMGLGHTPGAPEVMDPVVSGFPRYQGGDLNGLWQLGAVGGCGGFYS